MADNRYYFFKDAKGNKHTVDKTAYDKDPMGFAKAFPGARMEVIDRKTGRRGDVAVKDAGRIGDFGANLFTGRRVKKQPQQQPKTALGKAQQSVAQEKWGGGVVTQGNTTAYESASAPMENDSELVRGLKNADAVQRLQAPVSYTKPGAVKQMVKQTRERQHIVGQNVEQAGREFTNRERDRRNAPAFDLGNENVNNNIVKTRGQLEDELEESSRQLVDKQLGGYINNSIQKMFKDATVKGVAAEDALSKASPFAYMAAGKAYNEALDPDKLMNQLSKNAEKDMAGLFSDPKMQKEIAEKAASLGIDPEDYVKNYIAPGLQAKIAEEFEKSELSRNMPKSTAEYIIRGVNDSMIGTILSMGMMSKKQRQYAQQGMAMTDNGENPYVKPGMGARVARGTFGFAADAPVFGALGKAGAAVAGKVMGNGVAQAARIANTSLGGRIGRMAAAGAVSQGVTGVLYGSTNAAVQNYSTGDDTSIGNTVKLMTMGGLSEGASWATMGGIGGAVGAGIYNVSGVKRIPAKVFQLAMEGVGMHMGGNVAKMIEGHDTDWLSVEGNLEACANVVALKLTHARLPKRYAKDGKKESYLDMVARNIKNLMTSDGQRAAFGGYTFTNEEKEQLFGSASAPKRKESVYGYDVHDNPLTRKESLTSWAMRAKKTAAKGKGEESYKDTDAEFVKTAYDEIMADNSIPWNTKAKFSALVMGTVPSARPMMEYIRIEDGSVNEYSKNGELLSKNSFKTSDERDSILYSLNQKCEDQRLNNAYGAAQIKDEKAAQETLETVAETFGLTAEQLKTAMDKDPLKRSEEEQEACVALRKAYEGEQFPEGTLHPDQSQTEGKDVVEENGLGTENPNNEAVAEVLNNMNNAEKTFNAALESNDVLKQEYERLTKEGLSEPQIYMELINSGLTQEQLAPYADYINAKAKAVGMYRGTEQKIAETVQKHVEQWSYKGELNGEKQEGGQMLFVKDNNGRLLIVGAGDVAFDSEGRARENVGDMLSVLDPNTKEMDFVSKKDVQLDHVEKTEDYAKNYQEMLEVKNSVAYAESEKGKEKSEESEGGSEELRVKSEESNGNVGNESSEAHSYTLSEKKAGNGEPFYQDESGNIDLVNIPDEVFDGIGYTKAPFRLTPLMIKHMLDRHKKELGFKNENEAIDFVVDVMNNFDHVRLGYDGALVFSIENGRKRTGKRAVTVLINSDNGEFYGLKTSGYEGIKGLEKRPLLWERGANESSSTDAASASVTTGKSPISGGQSGSASHQGNSLHDKDSNNSPYDNGSNETLTFADGSPVPMMKDTKGREAADYSQMTPEQGAEWMSSQFGENAEAAVDGQIKRAEKMLKEAEKIKVDYTGDLNDAKEAEAQKAKAVDAAKAELELYTNIKKVMTANKVKAGMEKVGSAGEEGSVGSVGEVSVAVREKFEKSKKIPGRRGSITLPDGTKITGQYFYGEVSGLTPSHDPFNDFKQNEGFPVNEDGSSSNSRSYKDKESRLFTEKIGRDFGGQALKNVPVVQDGILLSGNGTTMGKQLAERYGTDGKYYESLSENAEGFGWTPKQIEEAGFKGTVYFVPDKKMPLTSKTFDLFNRQETKSIGNTEQSVKNAKVLSTDEVSAIIAEIEGSGSLDAFFNNPTAINSLLKRLIDKGVIGLNEVAGLREGEDRLSAAGKDFVKNLLLGSVFSEDTIRMMGADAMLKTKALNGIRAVIDNMKLGDYALMKEIDQAVQLLYEARQGGSGVDAYLRTPAMFGENAADRFDPISQAIALALEGKVEDFRELMMAYNRNAAPYADANQTEMFGERPTKEDFVNEFLKLKNWKDYETRHSSKEGNGDAGSTQGSEPETSGGSGRRRKEGLAKSGDKTLERKNIGDVSTEENGGPLEGDKEGKPGNDNGGSPDRDVQATEGQRQVDKAEEEKSDKPHEASLALTEPVEPTKPNGEEREGELPRTEEIEGDLAPQNKFKAYIESRDQGLKQVSPVAKALKEAVESGDKKRIKNAQKDLVEAILASPLGHGYLSSYLSICKNTKKNDKSYNVNKALIKPLTEVIKTIESALDSALKDAGLEGVHLSYDENGEGWIYADKNSPWYAQLKALDNDYRNISQIKENDPIAKLPQITLDNVADAARIIKSVIEEGERYNEYTEKEELNKEPLSILPKKEEKAFDPIGKAAENYKKDHPSVRMQKVDDADYIENIPKEYRDFSDEHKVNPVNLFGYGESMKYNDSAAASRYLHDLKAMYLREHVAEKKALMEREGVSGLIANRRLFAPIEKAIKEKYGDVDVLIEERKKRVEAERNVMEAARKRAEEEERKRQQHLEELSLIPDGDLDKRYLEAMEKGDEATAREMLDESARRKGYGDAESDYQGVGAWSAPSDPGFATAEERRADVKENGGDVNVEDIAAGYSPVQEEMYSHPERTGFGDEAGIEAGRAINDALNALKAGKTDVKIKVYRAVPTSVKEGKLRNGDWVTPSRKYAEMHGEHRLDGKYRIMEDEVPASELWFDGNDIREWGYDNGKSYRYKNVKNNRKLNDLVTRDDKGNVIPPSKRFNQRKADERYQRGVGGVKPSKAEVALRDAVIDRLRENGMDVIADEAEGQRVLDEANGRGETVRSQAMLSSLTKAVNTIRGWLATGKRGKSFTIELPEATQRMIRKVMGRDFDSHNITANGVAHAQKNHGVNGNKISDSSIPLREQDMELMPYIMVAPDYVRRGSEDVTGRTSVRFYKELSNGYVVVAEKEYKNSPDDMETITMWAEMSDKATNAQHIAAPDTHARNAILDIDAAKIRKDAEDAIVNDVKIRENRVYHGSGSNGVRFFRTANGEAYGFTVGGKIYIDPKIATSETPVHEYAHLWAEALRNGNPKEWQNVVELMKDTKVWDEVKARYPELKSDGDIADEVIATYSGRRGAERLREELRKTTAGNGGVYEKIEAISAFEKVRQSLEKFWKGVADFLHIRYTSAEEVADRVMKDLLDGVDPRGSEKRKVKSEKSNGNPRFQFIGEKGAAEADHAEEVSVRLDNLSVARDMEAEKKDAKAIKMATGWERGADGKWRYEIADMKEFDRNGNLLYRKHHPDYARYIELQDKELKNLFEDGEELTDKEREEYEALSKKYESDKFGGEKLDNNHTLEAYVDAPELFKAYPELRNVRMTFMDTGGDEIASYHHISSVFEVDKDDVGEIVVNTGKVSANTRTKELKSVVLHEMQHAIQDMEGFARGGNTERMKSDFLEAKAEWAARAYAHELEETAKALGEDYDQLGVERALIKEYEDMDMSDELPDKDTRIKGFNYFARGYADRSLDDAIKRFRLNESTRGDFNPYIEYSRLAGEVEARNVQKRMNMSAEERRASLAAETEDVAREDQIFLTGNNGVSKMDNRTEKHAADMNGKDNGVMYRIERAAEMYNKAKKLRFKKTSNEDSSKELYLSLQNKKGKEYYDTVTELARGMVGESGKAEGVVSEGQSQPRKTSVGRNTERIVGRPKSVVHCAAEIIAADTARSYRNGRLQQSERGLERGEKGALVSREKSSQSEVLSADVWENRVSDPVEREISKRIEDWAKQTNHWFDWRSLRTKYDRTKQLGDGTEAESDVFLSKDGKTVLKVVRSPHALYTSLQGKLNSIALHNKLFGDVGQTIIGITRTTETDALGKEVSTIGLLIEQPFVEGKPVADMFNNYGEEIAYIDKTMTALGFKPEKWVDNGGFFNGEPETVWRKGDVIVYDTHGNNIFIDKNGKPRLIDCGIETYKEYAKRHTIYDSAKARETEYENAVRAVKSKIRLLEKEVLNEERIIAMLRDNRREDNADKIDGFITYHEGKIAELKHKIRINAQALQKPGSVHYRVEPPYASLSLSKPWGGTENAKPLEGRIAETVEKVSKQTGGKVKMVNSVEEIENPKVRKDIENGKQVTGWYDEKTGEVHLYMPNIHDSYTAEKTVWHETVGHKGMRGLLGEKFDDYMRGLWMDLDNPINAELRAYVKEKMNMNHLGFYDAIEEFIAKSAEDGKGEPGFWNYIKNKVTDALHEIGYRVSPNVKDVKYMLWLAKNVQKHGDSPLWKMRAEAVRWKIEHEKTEYTKIDGGELYDNDGKSHDFEGMSREEWLEATDGEIHYRTAPSAATALDRYHHALDRHSYMATEAFMDNMLSLKKLMEAIDPSIRKIEDVNSSMNPYLMQNITEGKMSDKSKLFEIRYMDPLSKAMSSVLDSFDGKKVEDRIRNFNLYMIRKHGLERNRVLFVRDWIKSEKRKGKSEESDSVDALETAWKDERSDLRKKLDSGQIDLKEFYRQMDEWIVQNLDKDFKAEEHDYSGMHGLQGINDMKSPYDDAGAIDEVMSQEASMESMKKGSVADFWKKVKAATDYSVNSDYESGLISQITHDGVLDMFDWYVPLRKFDEATAEDVYGYVTEMGDPSNYIGTTLMNAKGRKSLSNVEILAQIGLMGNRAIRNGGQNMIKQAFARFVRNSGEQNLVKETKVWVEKTGTDLNGNDIWEEAYPQIPEGASADDVASIVDAFETDMRTKQAKGEAKSLSNGTDIGFKFQRAKDKSQHFVDVKIAGRTHRFVVLGNPRAAQALNGMLENGKASVRSLQAVTRWMAMASTSWSPEFVMRNIVRDMEFASSHVAAKEGGRYLAKWSRYYGELNPLNMFYNEGAGSLKSMKMKDFKNGVGFGLYARYREGTLGNSKMERYFKEFMENGGETGFVQLFSMHDMEKSYKSIVEKESAKGAKKVMVNAVEVLKKLGENVENLNEVAENMARFATYCTSRDLGRSAARSAYDAKEVSTNFNRHGSGDAIKSFKNGEMGDWQKARRNTYGFVAGYLRNYSMFFNAGIQSTNLLFKNIKRAPVGTTVAMTSAPFALALIMAAVNNAIIQNEDDKDRGNVKDPYGELPDYIRRNNLCIYVGNNKFVTVPLAIELRAFYSLGDLAAGQTFAKNVKSQRNMAMDAVGCMSQLFPVMDFLNNPNYEKSLENGVGMTTEGIAPTAIVPFIEWWLNNDWKGAPIRRTGDKTELNPAWQNAYNNVPARLVDLNKWVNAKTNNIAPGNPEMKGNDALDWITDPSMLNHFYESFSGGMGTFVKRTTGLVTKVATGKTDEIEVGDVPFLRSLFYTPREQSSMARTKAKWYNYKEEMEQTIANNDKLKSKNVPTMKRIENAAALEKFEGSPEQRKVTIIKNAEKRMRHWNTMRQKWADDKKQVDFANHNIEMIMQETAEELDRIE
jgi:hypothetical protein